MAGNTGYKNNWAKEKLDRISLTVPKGHRVELQEHAKAHAESLNCFINRAISETMDRDNLFSENKDKFLKQAEEYDVLIESLDEWKEIISALSVLEAKTPDIIKRYLSLLRPVEPENQYKLKAEKVVPTK